MCEIPFCESRLHIKTKLLLSHTVLHTILLKITHSINYYAPTCSRANKNKIISIHHNLKFITRTLSTVKPCTQNAPLNFSARKMHPANNFPPAAIWINKAGEFREKFLTDYTGGVKKCTS